MLFSGWALPVNTVIINGNYGWVEESAASRMSAFQLPRMPNDDFSVGGLIQHKIG